MVKSGSSYLSQSEMPVTFGLGKRDSVERAVLEGNSRHGRILGEHRNHRCTQINADETARMSTPGWFCLICVHPCPSVVIFLAKIGGVTPRIN
jgi:hypothetical protein